MDFIDMSTYFINGLMVFSLSHLPYLHLERRTISVNMRITYLFYWHFYLFFFTRIKWISIQKVLNCIQTKQSLFVEIITETKCFKHICDNNCLKILVKLCYKGKRKHKSRKKLFFFNSISCGAIGFLDMLNIPLCFSTKFPSNLLSIILINPNSYSARIWFDSSH